MNRTTLLTALCTLAALLAAPLALHADELLQMIQQDLVTLGYDPGNTDGEPSLQTTVAISAFQTDNALEVTGEATPQLAGILQSKAKQKTTASAERTQEELEAAQKACLEEKVAARQKKQKTASAVGGLLSAAGRTTGMLGGSSGDLYRTAGVIYGANATADQVSRAAKDLGLSEADIEACRNPD